MWLAGQRLARDLLLINKSLRRLSEKIKIKQFEEAYTPLLRTW